MDYRIRPGGPWQRMLRGVYKTSTGEPGPDQLLMAALLYAGEGSMISGLAALRHYKITVPNGRLIDVLIPAERHRISSGFVVTHRTTRTPRRFAAHGPIQFASPERAVADAALGLVRLADVRAVAAGAVQQGWCTVGALAAELDAGPHRGSGRLRIALTELGDGIRSAAEADLRTLLKRGRLPSPMFNPRLRIGGCLIAVPDAWWPQAGLVVEVDSREWHLSPAEWERTMRRHAAMTALGILVLHFSPRQIRDEPEAVLKAIRAALRAGSPRPGITADRAA